MELQLACILHPRTMQNPLYFSRGDPWDMQQHADLSNTYYGIYARETKCILAYTVRVRLAQVSMFEGADRYQLCI